MKKAPKKEVWKVDLHSETYHEDKTIFVFANCAAQAEKRALELSQVIFDNFTKPYCTMAKFEQNVY